MKIIPCYKNKIINIPAETILPELSSATREELAVLIAIIAEPEFDVSALSAKLNITESTLISAVGTWTRKGAVSVIEQQSTSAVQKPDSPKTQPVQTEANVAVSQENTKKPVIISNKTKSADDGKPAFILQSSTLPHYSVDEVADYLEGNSTTSNLIDSCQMILGKVLNAAETAIIIGLIDHLSLSPEYVMLLFAHAAKMGKQSVRYIEKLALSFFDRGILTYPELIEEVSAKEAAADMEAYIRKLIGIGRRAYTDAEHEMIDLWTNKYKMNEEMVKHAYEITIAKTNEPSMPYMNAIIENWHKAGYANLEEITNAEEAYKRDKELQDASRSSFTTDEFYEAALSRSYDNLKK